MDIDKYIESMHPASEKERVKLKKILRNYYVYDHEYGVREIRVRKGYYIPFRGNLYGWHELMYTATVKVFKYASKLVVDEYGLLWLRIHYHDTQHDDDPEVFFPVENADEAEALFDKEGPYAAAKYIWNSLDDGLVVPHFRYNDGPYLYFVTDDLSLSRDDMFDLLVTSNVLHL